MQNQDETMHGILLLQELVVSRVCRSYMCPYGKLNSLQNKDHEEVLKWHLLMLMLSTLSSTKSYHM